MPSGTPRTVEACGRFRADIALSCARENTLLLEDAKALVANGCKVVGEGANMPTTLEATSYFIENGVAFMPGKAANAGGVSVSGLEMTQNSERLSWSFEEVDNKLKDIMVSIYHAADDAAKRYGHEGNYVMGAQHRGLREDRRCYAGARHRLTSDLPALSYLSP